MITEAIFKIFLVIPNLLINLLPAITWTIPAGIFDVLGSIMHGLAYFLPLPGLVPILVFSTSFYAVKIVWALLLRIKSFIPTMGS